MNKLCPFNCNYSTRHAKNRRKSVIHFDILTFLHAITFMIQTKTNGAEVLSLQQTYNLNNTSEKIHFVYQLPHFGKMSTVAWIRNKPFFVAIQIHICYHLSVSRLPSKIREDRCSLLYKRSNICTLGKHLSGK